ncbi:YdiY family protein [Candidatus Omnitrophota bacterium]
MKACTVVLKRSAVCALIVLLCSPYLYADEVYLKNGDKITGEVTEERTRNIIVTTDAMGEVTIDRSSIERIERHDVLYFNNNDRISGSIVSESETDITIRSETLGTITVKKGTIKKQTDAIQDRVEAKKNKPQEIEWKREVSAGYTLSKGNTENSTMAGSFFLSRNMKHVDEVTLKGDVYYGESDKKMDAQRWYGMGRYAVSFGSSRRWYGFVRGEADHDRFANIDYRLIPSAGVGYWLYDLEDLKLLAELAIGLEHTDFRDETEDSNEAIYIPRIYAEKKLFDAVSISESLTFYLPFAKVSNYRLRSKTSLNTSINEMLTFRIQLIDDYNSAPPDDTSKNDMRIISSLAYSF